MHPSGRGGREQRGHAHRELPGRVRPSILDAVTPLDLVEKYRAAFARYDLVALVDCFAFPVQVVGVADSQAFVSTSGPDQWSDVLRGLLDAYAKLGVADAVPLALEISEPMDAVAIVHVHWALKRADGDPIYDFRASYTVARVAGECSIVAIAHDEMPKLRNAMSRA